MKTGLIRKTVGLIMLNIRVFDLGTLEGLSTLLGNEPGYIKGAIEQTIWNSAAPEDMETYRENWLFDGISWAEYGESDCDKCQAYGLLRDLVTQVENLDPGTQKSFAPILNEIDKFLTAQEYMDNENLDGGE